MSDKKQPKKSGREGRGRRVVKAVVEAVAECQAKAGFDYQRISVCVADNSREGEGLARACRVGLSRGVLRKNSRRCGPVAVMEVGERELLVAAVRAVNQRRAVVVLVTTREGFAKWSGRWEVEAGKIRRRTHVVLRVEEGKAKIDG